MLVESINGAGHRLQCEIAAGKVSPVACFPVVLLSVAMRLEHLTSNDWALLQSKSRKLSFNKGEPIIQINSRPTTLFIMRKGSATVEVIKGKVIARLAPGDICGEMAFIENSVTSASVLAAEGGTEVDAIDLSEVSSIFSSFPHLEARFYKSLALVLSQRLRRTSSELAKSMARH